MDAVPLLHGLRILATLGGRGLRHDGGVRAVGIAPGGLAYASVGDGPRLHFWDAQTGHRTRAVEGTATERPYAFCFSDDGRFAYVAGAELQVFDLAQGRSVGQLLVKEPPVTAVASRGDLVLYGDERRPRCFDRAANEQVFMLKSHAGRVNACALSSDAALGLTCGGDRVTRVHLLDRARTKPKVLATLEGYARSCGFTPDDRLAWSVGWDHVRFFDPLTGVETWSLEGPLARARVGALSADGGRLAVAYDTEVLVFELPSKEPSWRIACSGVDTMAFDPLGSRLLVANDGYAMGEGCAIEVFEVETERRVLPLDEGHIGGVADLAIPQERPTMLLSTGVDARVLLWDLESGCVVEQLGPLTNQGQAVAVSTDGRIAVTTARDGSTLRWDLTAPSSTVVPTNEVSRQGVDVALSADGQLVAFAARDRVLLFDRAHGDAEPIELAGHGPAITAIALAPDGSRLCAAGTDGKVIIWALPSAERTRVLDCGGPLQAIAFLRGSPRALVTGTMRGELSVFDIESGQRRTRHQLDTPLTTLATIGDGHVALIRRSALFDSDLVEVWSLARRQTEGLVDLSPIGDQPRSITGSPDGRRVYVGTNLGMILVLERTGS